MKKNINTIQLARVKYAKKSLLAAHEAAKFAYAYSNNKLVKKRAMACIEEAKNYYNKCKTEALVLHSEEEVNNV